MLARTRILRIQKQIYDSLRVGARAYLGGLRGEMKRYFREYQQDFARFDHISSKQELIARLLESDIVFCGDYHTLSQAQKTVIRLLEEAIVSLEQQRRKVILALEMVTIRDESSLQQYLSGELPEEKFLKAIDFHRNWGFHWENYRSLFHFAASFGIEVVGVNVPGQNRKPTLRDRDRYAAKIIARLTLENPNSLIVVLVGDLHVSQTHLPYEVEKELERCHRSKKTLIIHQNNENLYWKLVAADLEHRVEVLKVRDRVYCVMNTPPWVKLRSHLKWMEWESARTSSRRDNGARPLEEVDFSDEVVEFLHAIKKFMDIREPLEDDFTVWAPDDIAELSCLIQKSDFSRFEIKMIAIYLRAFESYFIPRKNFLYLASLSPNHAATQAAIYFHGRLSGFESIFTDPNKDFYPFAWIEALGFMGSKILNHKRKCTGVRDLERFLQKKRRLRNDAGIKDKCRLAKLALRWLERERESVTDHTFGFPRRHTVETVLDYYRLARILGRLLGAALYTAIVDGKVSRKQLVFLFRTKWDQKSAKELYFHWIHRLDAHGYRDIAKGDRM